LSCWRCRATLGAALAEKQAEHVWKRRPREARGIVLALPGVISRIKYVGRIPGKHHPQESSLVLRRTTSSYCASLKFVSATKARSGADEAWLKTAYFAGAKEIRRLLGRTGHQTPASRSLTPPSTRTLLGGPAARPCVAPVSLFR
jgi:hypothetical protein